MLLLVPLLAPFVVLATRVLADSTTAGSENIISVPLTKRLVGSTGTVNIAQRDDIRSTHLGRGQYFKCSTPDIPLNEVLAEGYTATIGVGRPPTFYQLIVDTGSSNTWVGANKSYVITNSSMKTSDSFNVTYGSGQVNGTEYIDTVMITPGAVISHQSIGVASNSTGFSPFDGIFGIGPVNLTLNTTFPDNSSLIPTVTDNLVKQGTIKQNVVGVYFEPSNKTSDINLNGELTLGGTNPAKYIGDITYHNITKSHPANLFFGIDGSFRYGNETIFNTSSGIVDTGTTLIGLNTSAYNLYVNATGAVYDNKTQFLRITTAQSSNLQSLFFIADGISYEVIPNAQIFPRTFNTLPVIGGDEEHLYLTVFDLGTHTGFDFIVGMAFLQRYYSIYDNERHRVGFASTRFTNVSDIN